MASWEGADMSTDFGSVLDGIRTSTTDLVTANNTNAASLVRKGGTGKSSQHRRSQGTVQASPFREVVRP